MKKEFAKITCSDCGQPVRQRLVNGAWIPDHCDNHPTARRYRRAWAAKQFEQMRAAVKAAIDWKPDATPNMPAYRGFMGGGL